MSWSCDDFNKETRSIQESILLPLGVNWSGNWRSDFCKFFKMFSSQSLNPLLFGKFSADKNPRPLYDKRVGLNGLDGLLVVSQRKIRSLKWFVIILRGYRRGNIRKVCYKSMACRTEDKSVVIFFRNVGGHRGEKWQKTFRLTNHKTRNWISGANIDSRQTCLFTYCSIDITLNKMTSVWTLRTLVTFWSKILL